MEIVAYVSIIVSLWFSGVSIYNAIKKDKWMKYTRSLRGRVVRFEDGFSKEKSISPYGEIVVISGIKNYKFRTIDVRVYPDESYTKKAKAEYDKQFELALKEYERLRKIYDAKVTSYGGRDNFKALQKQQYYMAINGYSSNYKEYREPLKPLYNFISNSNSFTLYGVKKSVTKLMPEFFDIETGSIIKPIQERKGVKRQKNHMPRIYKYLFLLALVMFVFSLVNNVDNTMPGFFHWFISH